MKKLLLTGFEPFDGENLNPSWELVKLFNHKIINHYQVITKQIPTVFYESANLLKQYMIEYEPDIVICIGQAGGSNTIRLEKIAINLNDARIPDNKGNQPIDEFIIIQGENAYFSKLPVRKLYDELKKHHFPVSISLSAGAYVCNHIFYHLMNMIQNTNQIGGFIHIPYMKEQVTNKPETFSIDLLELEKALNLIMDICIQNVN